jgi:hypothetical protein
MSKSVVIILDAIINGPGKPERDLAPQRRRDAEKKFYRTLKKARPRLKPDKSLFILLSASPRLSGSNSSCFTGSI